MFLTSDLSDVSSRWELGRALWQITLEGTLCSSQCILSGSILCPFISLLVLWLLITCLRWCLPCFSISKGIILPFVINTHFKGRYIETMATPHCPSNVHPLFLASIDDFHLNQLLTWWLQNWFYINVQILSDLDRRRPFTLAALSFLTYPHYSLSSF